MRAALDSARVRLVWYPLASCHARQSWGAFLQVSAVYRHSMRYFILLLGSGWWGGVVEFLEDAAQGIAFLFLVGG